MTHPATSPVIPAMSPRIRLLAALLGAALAAPLVAQDFEAGSRAAAAGDFETALANWQPLAEEGQVAAQFNLAMMHARGDGVPQDYARAADWFRKAAEEQDLGRAYFWFTIAGFQNFYPAREAQQQVRGMISPGQIGYVEQQVRDWLSREAGMEFQRQPES